MPLACKTTKSPNIQANIGKLLSMSFSDTKKRAENRIRTDDPRITNALLYQLSYPGKV